MYKGRATSVTQARCYKTKDGWAGDFELKSPHYFKVGYSNFGFAKSVAEGMVAKGFVVILRPLANEYDRKKKKKFFREWRSFDGESLREIRWYENGEITKK